MTTGDVLPHSFPVVRQDPLRDEPEETTGQEQTASVPAPSPAPEKLTYAISFWSSVDWGLLAGTVVAFILGLAAFIYALWIETQPSKFQSNSGMVVLTPRSITANNIQASGSIIVGTETAPEPISGGSISITKPTQLEMIGASQTLDAYVRTPVNFISPTLTPAQAKYWRWIPWNGLTTDPNFTSGYFIFAPGRYQVYWSTTWTQIDSTYFMQANIFTQPVDKTSSVQQLRYQVAPPNAIGGSVLYPLSVPIVCQVTTNVQPTYFTTGANLSAQNINCWIRIVRLL